MASIDAQQTQPPSSSRTDADRPINKRTSIGLSARRPTAPDTVQRPPTSGGLSAWWLVFWLTMLTVAAIFLIAATAIRPTITLGDVAMWIGRAPKASVTTTTYFQDAFDADTGRLTAFAQPNVAAATVLPAQGVYRLDVWPGNLAWSRFHIDGVDALRVNVEATIDGQTPEAAVALIGRFEDDATFYLFTVDGKGRFGALRYQNGAAAVLRPPTPLPAINPAGAPNRLTLEDRGTSLRFLGNGILLDVIPVEPATDVRAGVGALATSDDIATVTFDSITVQQP